MLLKYRYQRKGCVGLFVYQNVIIRLLFEIQGTRDIPLTQADGIDILGNIIEASLLSVNPNRYGDIHNMGHIMLSYIHDPDNRFLVSTTDEIKFIRV